MDYGRVINNDCPMPKQGGTTMWCEECEDNRPCKAIPVPVVRNEPSERNYSYPLNELDWSEKVQSGYLANLPWIHVFQRGRECSACGEQWVTYEVAEDVIFSYIGALSSQDRAAEALNEARNVREEAVRTLTRLKKQLGAIGEHLPDLKDT